MKQPKIYFAKSNLCNPNRIAEIRMALQSLDIEIVEFQGGEYSDKELLKSDYLVICSYEEETDFEGCSIGKGLYNQINSFNNSDNILFLLPGNNKQLLFTKMEDIYIHDEGDWKRKYAIVEYEDTESKWLTTIFPIKETTIIKPQLNKYLLIT